MKQCLVTRLKEVISDSSLLKLGERTFTLVPGGKVVMRGRGIKVRAINGTFSTKVSSVITSGLTSIEDTTGYYVTYTNESSSTPLLLGVQNLSFLESITTGDFGSTNPQLSVDLSFFELSNKISEMHLAGQDVSGDFKSLANITKNSSLLALSLSKTKVNGNIKDLGVLKVNKGVDIQIIYCPNVTGDVVDFVKAQRLNGRSSDSFETYFGSGTQMTFNGTPTSAITYPTTLAWTENTITFGGQTINA